MVYLDNNATTEPLPEVREAMTDALANGWGNPSSPHARGVASRKRLSEARQRVAQLVDGDENKVFFTSGGTEANAIAILSAASAGRDQAVIVTTPVEHTSVLHACERLERQGATILYLDVDSSGRVDPEQLADLLEAQPASLVSIQWANNETGVLQPIPELAEIARRYGVRFHSDAAQAIGKVELETTEVDIVTFTGHKLHGPPGVGAIWARDTSQLSSLVGDGSQEDGIRPGTENLPGIIGFGVAAEKRRGRLAAISSRGKELRDRFETRIREGVPNLRINGTTTHRVWNCTNLCFPGLDGQAIVAQLDAAGICASQTSACTTGIPEPSHVLRAMGLNPEDAFSSVRFSLSELNGEAEVLWAADRVVEIADRLASFLPSARREAV